MTKRILTALLAAVLSLSTLACAADNGTDTPDTTTTDTTVQTEETTTQPPETEYELAVKSAHYENAPWNVLTYTRSAPGGLYQHTDIDWQEELAGDVFNDALYARNMKIEEDFGVVIHVTQSDAVKSTLMNLSTAGDTTYAMVAAKMDEALAAAQEGAIHELTALEYIQIDAPWWEPALFRDMAIGSKLYMLTGDISVMDEEMLYVIFCNKKLLADYKLEDPYDVVRDDRWTLDTLHTMANGVNDDVNGDGVFDEKDRYGFGSDYSTSMLLFYAAGGTIAEMDKEGVPQLTLLSEQNEKILDRIAQFHNDATSVVNASTITGTWNSLKTMMMEDRLLFQQGNVYNIPGRREMISDFGILPLPKYSEEQEDYRHVVATNYATGMTLPSPLAGKDLERAAVVLNAMSAVSGDMMDAYYEVNLKHKNMRDEDSAAMLEIIFTSKCFDLGKVFAWGKLETAVVREAIKTPGTFVSNYESNQSAAETAMAKSYEFFK